MFITKSGIQCFSFFIGKSNIHILAFCRLFKISSPVRAYFSCSTYQRWFWPVTCMCPIPVGPKGVQLGLGNSQTSLLLMSACVVVVLTKHSFTKSRLCFGLSYCNMKPRPRRGLPEWVACYDNDSSNFYKILNSITSEISPDHHRTSSMLNASWNIPHLLYNL